MHGRTKENDAGFPIKDVGNDGFGVLRAIFVSMTDLGRCRLFLYHVYYVPSKAGMLYIKFTADAVTEFLLLSFKEKEDG